MFRVEISTSNSAFEANPEAETARILEAVADRIAEGFLSSWPEEDPMLLKDANGNTVGRAYVTDEE